MFVVPATVASVVRYPLGGRVGPLGPRPDQRLELYEYEACPFCRKVREAATMLDLELLVKPCPRGGGRFRDEALRLGGKAQFPLLVDPNAGLLLHESDAIVRHLYARYGVGEPPLGLRLGALGDATSAVASLARASHGRRAKPSRAPSEPLHLWSVEASPYCRRVREVLAERELPYVLHNLAKGSAGRAAFLARHGKVQIPYLEDPGTGAALFESRDIVRYLETTYGA